MFMQLSTEVLLSNRYQFPDPLPPILPLNILSKSLIKFPNTRTDVVGCQGRSHICYDHCHPQERKLLYVQLYSCKTPQINFCCLSSYLLDCFNAFCLFEATTIRRSTRSNLSSASMSSGTIRLCRAENGLFVTVLGTYLLLLMIPPMR